MKPRPHFILLVIKARCSFRRALSALLLALLALAAPPAFAKRTVRIGILSHRGPYHCMQQWGATGDYLSGQLRKKILILPLKFKSIIPALNSRQVDFLLINPAIFVRVRQKIGMTAIATLIRSIDGRPYKQFGGVLFTLRGSPVKTLEDVRGARVMRVKATSFGGGISAWRLFVDNGILPGAEFSYTSGNSHDSVVFEVRDAKSDVGVVRTGILESMHAEGAIDKDMFRIIHAVDDDFPQVHSTRLYPEWPMAACPWTRRKLAKEMAVALIALPPNTTAAENAQCFGWAPPLDYSPVEECLAVVQEAIRAQKEKEGSAEKPAEDVAEPANPPVKVKETPGGTASS